ncbi:uncharacterized protein LOC141811053 [Halichoeres trimaculatus]|uniref:uncharacterized protein LOC141811053 n=1 Tax=Halichoeres trimaculatus TaxID=147232 RepID=UPI003D9F7A12
MSLQVCHCGWSKFTSYQGLRTHQGKKGCTPQGLKIPESEQYRFNRFVPMVTYLRPTFGLTDPFMDILKSSTRSVPPSSRITELEDESRSRINTSSNREIIPSLVIRKRIPERKPLAGLIQAPASPPESPPPVAREAETPQTIQTFADALQIGSNSPADAGPCDAARVPLFGRTPSMFSGPQIFGNQTNPANTGVFGTATGASAFSFGAQQNVFPSPSIPTSPPRFPEAREAETPQMTQAFSGAGDSTNVPLFGQSPSMISETQIFGSQTNPTNTEVKLGMTNQTLFQSPPQVFGAAPTASTFSFGAQQNVSPNPFMQTGLPRFPEAREAETPHVTQTRAGAGDSASFPLFGQAPSMFSGTQSFGNQTNPAITEVNAGISNQTSFGALPQVFGAAAGAATFSFGTQQKLFPTTSTPLHPPRIPEAREAETPQMTQTFTDSLQQGSNSNRVFATQGTTSAARVEIPDLSSPPVSVTRITSNQTTPANKEVKTEASNRAQFETPQKVTEKTTRARRALDFSTGAQQLESWDIPTTTAQETFTRLRKKEIDRAKAKCDKIRADLQTRVQKTEQKMDRIKSSELDCKCSLDAEWLEINNVFSDVQKVVEEARRKALKPVEERSKKLEMEAKVLVQKLQKEIDGLKKSMDELDQNQDQEVSPPTGLDEPQSWKNVTLDTAFSFGSLRTTTSKMVKRIETTLERLSSTELKRTAKFAVDVKLDPTTAHPCLDVSPDGKTVGYVGKVHKVSDCPQRFDKFGSILGINKLTSGKSYWEVEVRNKSGWDLGVARGDITRKGDLSVNTDKGFWVVVHYEDKKYAALTVPPVCLALTQKPQRVGVFVDYEEGLVSFYDVTAKAHIHSFTECSFSGDVFPYFSPHLKHNEKNAAPLIISAVNSQQ